MLIYLLSIHSQINELNDKLNSICDKLFENPMSGSVVFAILATIGILAVRGYAKK